MPHVVDQLLEVAVIAFMVTVVEAVLPGYPFVSDAEYVQNLPSLPVIFRSHLKTAVLPGAKVLTLGGVGVALGLHAAVYAVLVIVGTRLVNVPVWLLVTTMTSSVVKSLAIVDGDRKSVV